MPLDLIMPPQKKVVTADYSGIDRRADTMSEIAHRQWASRPSDQRFTTMDDLIAAVNKRSQTAKTRKMLLADIEPVFEHDQIGFHVGNGEVLTPTHYSFGQLCHADNLGVPAGFLRNFLDDDPETVVRILDKARRQLAKPDREVGIYSAETNMRALTGANYGRLMDLEVVTALWNACQESGFNWQVPTAFATPGSTFTSVDPTKESTTLYASDRDVWVFLVDQTPIQVGWITDPRTGERKPDLYFRGFIVRNSECGGIGLMFTTFLYRMVCCNRRIWGMNGWQQINLKHTKNVHVAFREQLVPAAKEFLNGTEAGIADAIQKVAARPLVRSDKEALHVLVHDLKFSESVAKSIVGRSLEEDGVPLRTTENFVQAITAEARTIPYTDERAQMEKVAANLEFPKKR